MMECLIRHIVTGQFLSIDKNHLAVWTQAAKAQKFGSHEKAANYMANNFNAAVNGLIGKDEVEVVSAKDYMEATSIVQVSAEDAERMEAALPAMIEGMYEAAKSIRLLLHYYKEQARLTDLEQEDLLHKIEFTKAGAVDGYKLYKSLHDLRQRRRKCKDMQAMLQTAEKTGVLTYLQRMESALNKYQSHMESRAYSPRILKELFDAEIESEESLDESA